MVAITGLPSAKFLTLSDQTHPLYFSLGPSTCKSSEKYNLVRLNSKQFNDDAVYKIEDLDEHLNM